MFGIRMDYFGYCPGVAMYYGNSGYYLETSDNFTCNINV